jgi:hypothetical protein
MFAPLSSLPAKRNEEENSLKVSIEGDKVTVNGVDGKLRPSDSVLISDDGVAVNSLDYGESAKYLQANNSSSDVSGLN